MVDITYAKVCIIACCLLPVACCLLPVACCLLPVACCLLPCLKPHPCGFKLAVFALQKLLGRFKAASMPPLGACRNWGTFCLQTDSLELIMEIVLYLG